MKVEVVRSGIHATVQDLGRTGLRRHGVSVGGALDPVAARISNLLVGNAESSAVLEMALGGLRLRLADERVVAWCGAPFEAKLGGRLLLAGRACRAHAGDEITFRAPPTGLRAWLAVSGGIDVPVVLGSRSTDLRARFGGLDGRALQDADTLPLGRETAQTDRLRALLPHDECANWSASREPHDSSPTLRVLRGRDAAPDTFFEQAFTVTPDSDRMGLRLTGTTMEIAPAPDISEAVAPGTVQLPPSGQPIVLLADCQTIGGYPRIAHVITVDLPRAAQLRPGDQVHFREVTFDEACALRLASERSMKRLRTGLALRIE